MHPFEEKQQEPSPSLKTTYVSKVKQTRSNSENELKALPSCLLLPKKGNWCNEEYQKEENYKGVFENAF